MRLPRLPKLPKLPVIRWNPWLGLVALFFLYALAGIFLSLFYALWMERVMNPAGQMVAPLFFGGLLGLAVYGAKRFCMVRWDVPATVLVGLATYVVYLLMWGEFPLRGTAEAFSFWERQLPEAAMALIENWALPARTMLVISVLEVLAIALPPMYMAFRRAGVFLHHYNRWAKLKVLDYGFIPFHDHELDRLAAGSAEVFIRKNIDLTGHKRIHCVALCYIDEKLTEYLAVFKAGWSRQGAIEKGSLLLLAVLPMEKISHLQDALYEIHRESEFED